MKLATPPAVAIFPLGTGNDLARTLGWGAGSDSSEDVCEAMARIEKAEVVPMDRWKVEVQPRRHLRIRLPRTTILMNNYLSIGVDALVTFNFHKARESPFYLISSRIINKLIYFSYGTKDVLERQCQNLHKKLELHMDGVKIELPEIESVVILNIPYWGAGVQPWCLGSAHKDFPHAPSISDQKLEVFCVYSSFHIAQMQVGLSEPHRVGQATEVKIKLLDSAPMQIDGEPWEQHPAEISLTHHAQSDPLGPLTSSYVPSALSQCCPVRQIASNDTGWHYRFIGSDAKGTKQAEVRLLSCDLLSLRGCPMYVY